MTAIPAPFDPAPLTARVAFLAVALWARARLATRRAVARRLPAARRATSVLLELAGGAAVVRGLWELAPWLGWSGLGLVLGVAGWMLEPREGAPS